MAPTFLTSCHDAFTALVAQQKSAKNKASDLEKKGLASQADDLIQFRQLRSQAVQGGIEVDLMDADDISRAVGSEGAGGEGSRLKHVYQLTGYSDPVYAEASVTVHDYDIVLEMNIINRTPNTLTNLTVELATMGDLKLVERPQSHTIGPLDERKLRANIKVSSTETGHIFGTIVFDNSSTAQKTYVNLSDIQLDIMDYIRPAECKSEDFRSMWAEFEWENKVAINTNITDLREFLAHIVSNTNMTCLSPLGENDSVRLSVFRTLFTFWSSFPLTHPLSLSSPYRTPWAPTSWPPTSTRAPSLARTPWSTCRSSARTTATESSAATFASAPRRRALPSLSGTESPVCNGRHCLPRQLPRESRKQPS
jgi:hypothetical protein